MDADVERRKNAMIIVILGRNFLENQMKIIKYKRIDLEYLDLLNAVFIIRIVKMFQNSVLQSLS